MNQRIGSLVTVLLASQAAACVLYTDEGSETGAAAINAQWSFRDAATQATTGCPAGFDTIVLNSQPVDVGGNVAGPVISDLFDCVDLAGTSAPLPPTIYQSWAFRAFSRNFLTPKIWT